MARLLLLACSRRKRPTPAFVPAIDRYDGPVYRVLRRYLRLRSGDEPEVYVLSAEFGLVPADRPIPEYDRKMTAERARELRSVVTAGLLEILTIGSYEDTLAVLGRVYAQALDIACLSDKGHPLRVVSGAPGRQSAELWDWLYRGAPTTGLPVSRVDGVGSGRAHLRGVEVSASPDEVLAAARYALAFDRTGIKRYQAWCVDVDGVPVGPKWLVSVLTGLPVGAFSTDDARRVLAELGIPVRRTLPGERS